MMPKKQIHINMNEFAGTYTIDQVDDVLKHMKIKVKKAKACKPLKTYVLIVSCNFPATHTNAKQPTFFVPKIKKVEKIHTIRTNYYFWKKRIDEINKGNAVLSVRFWTGNPYNSKQKEVCKFHKLGIQKIDISTKKIKIDKIEKTDIRTTLSHNDGLSLTDFNNWFKKPLKNGCIIHFTERRY
jgi:hypothetical protein